MISLLLLGPKILALLALSEILLQQVSYLHNDKKMVLSRHQTLTVLFIMWLYSAALISSRLCSYFLSRNVTKLCLFSYTCFVNPFYHWAVFNHTEGYVLWKYANQREDRCIWMPILFIMWLHIFDSVQDHTITSKKTGKHVDSFFYSFQHMMVTFRPERVFVQKYI
jgi:hypothetical protein